MKIIKLILIFCLCLVSSLVSIAQTTASGRVIDDQGVPVVGASVIEQGSKDNGTFTDKDGHFHLNVKKNALIEISFIGLKSVVVKAAKNLEITLNEDKNMLNTVVVNGYQSIKKERMTGAVATINAKDIKNLNIKSMDQVLQGTIAGVSALSSGAPGADAHIQIRGVNSLSGNTEPVWIVDGMPLQGEVPNIASGSNINASMFQSGIGNIAPDDIESITVLKDAAASAIYGARAANGVIVVTTKKGREGKVNVNFTANLSVRQRPKMSVAMMNSQQKLKFEEEIYKDIAEPYVGRGSYLLRQSDYGVISPQQAQEQIDDLKRINTDWFKEIYRPSFSQQITTSASGGSSKTQFYTSLNLLNENGIERNNVYKRGRFTSKVTHIFGEKLYIDTDLGATYRTNRSSASVISPLQYAMFANPYESPKTPDLSWDMKRSRNHPGFVWTTLNAIDDMEQNTEESRYLEASLRGGIHYKPWVGMEISSVGIVAFSNNNARTTENPGTYTNFQHNWLNFTGQELNIDQVRGSLLESSNYMNSYTIRNTIDYNKEQGRHFINVFLGNEVSSSVNFTSFNYSPVFDPQHRIIGYPTIPKGTSLDRIPLSNLGDTGKWESRIVSFFLSGTYSYKDAYVVSASVRYDGADIIGNKNQFTPLWNVSAKYNLGKEKFFQNNVVNELSFRFGYGYTGSIDKNALPFPLMMFDESILYAGQSIPTSFSFANPNIKWQTKRDFNIGVESSYLDGRIYLNLNYYHNFVFDLLDRRSRPLSSGRRNVVANVANIINKGIEIELGADIIRYKDLIWNIRGNFSYNNSTITKTYLKQLEDLPTISAYKGKSYYVENYAPGAWFGYKFNKVNPINGHTLIYDEDKEFDMDAVSNVTTGIKPPVPSFLGNYIAPYIGGFSTSINYRRFYFNMNCEFRAGHYIKSFNTFDGLGSRNRSIKDQYRWRSAGDNALMPEISFTSVAYGNYMYDVMLEKGDYLRATYTSLGYNLGNKLVKAMHIGWARLTLSVSNLFTLTSYKGIDPTLMGGFGYPNTRVWSASVNVGF